MFAELFAGYSAAVSEPGGPLDADTVRAYCSRVRQFLVWLADAIDAGAVDGDPLTDPDARNGAVRDFRTYLLTVAKRKLSTVNAHLTAIDDLYRHLGLGPAVVKRQEVPKAASRALPGRARWLRAAQRADARGKALAYVGYHAGLRGAEAVALDLDDVRISARKGVLIVRYRKGGRYRDVPLHPHLRTVLDEWTTERAKSPGAKENPALFLNRRGGRLSTRGAYDVLKAIAADANLEFGRDGDLTPHVLRHTTGTNLVRDGEDIVTVAEILGHSIETARRYSLPTEATSRPQSSAWPSTSKGSRSPRGVRVCISVALQGMDLSTVLDGLAANAFAQSVQATSVRPRSAALGRNAAGCRCRTGRRVVPRTVRGCGSRW